MGRNIVESKVFIDLNDVTITAPCNKTYNQHNYNKSNDI